MQFFPCEAGLFVIRTTMRVSIHVKMRGVTMKRLDLRDNLKACKFLPFQADLFVIRTPKSVCICAYMYKVLQ
jgi:hypothetical protein